MSHTMHRAVTTAADAGRKPRVLFLLIHLHRGGMQRAISNITFALGTRFELVVAYFGSEDPGFVYNAEAVNLDIAGSRRAGIWIRLTAVVRRIITLRRFVRQRGIDVVITFGENANVLSALTPHGAAKVFSLRVAIAKALAESRYGALYSILLRLLYPQADRLVAVSRDLRTEAIGLGCSPDNIICIPNLYDIARIREKAVGPPRGVPEEWLSQYLISVGSHIPQKGHDLLLAAVAAARRRGCEIKLVLMGDGPQRPDLEAFVSETGLAGNVRFLPYDPNPYPYLAKAKLFVLSSRYEGFPNILVEAMACGLPCIAFDCPTGPREILKGDVYGMLAKSESVQDLTDKLIELHSNAQLRTRYAAASERRCADYSADRIGIRWAELIEAAGDRFGSSVL